MAQIEQQSELEFKFDEEDLIDDISEKEFTLGCFKDDEIIGYIMFDRDWYYDNDIYLFNIMVDENFRGYGIGKKLFINSLPYLKSVLDAKEVSLEVEKHNPAIKFYEKLGFKSTNHESYVLNKNIVMSIKKEKLVTNLEKIANEIDIS